MNMVEPSVNGTLEGDGDEEEVAYDCIWIIRPPPGYMHLKTHISLRVETFEKMASKSEITILQGTTSDRPLMERVVSSLNVDVQSRDVVVPITSGFYVRLRGKFNSESRIAIVYTAFNFGSKFAVS